MCILSRFWQGLNINERGQIAILVGFLMVGMIGFSALAIDVGSLVADKRDLQNAADAMALAGAQALPIEGTAKSTATTWAGKNGVASGEIASISVLQQSLPSVPNPKIVVTLHRHHRTTLARVIGVGSVDLDVTASAIKTSPGGSDNLAPWSVLESVIQRIAPGDVATLKFDSNNVNAGNFQPISIDGTGASTYSDTIEHGSNGTLCSAAALLNGCVTTAQACSGAHCNTETGNMIGPTKTGVDYIIANTDPACSQFSQIFTSNGDGTYRITQDCNPFIPGGKSSLRVIIVPVIDSLPNGKGQVTVERFALFFLEGYGNKKCTGNSCEIKGRFIRANFTTGAVKDVYDPGGLLHFVVLVQ